MIAMRNVEKFFESGVGKTFVLRRVNIDIKPGEFVSIMGPSGAGKSTLLHIIGMHDSAWTGEFTFSNSRFTSSARRSAPSCETRTSASCFRAIICSIT